MAKNWERREAEKMYIKEGKTAKDIAHLLKVTEKTVGKWIDEGNWKDRRADFLSSNVSVEEKITKLASVYVDRLASLAEEEPGDDLEEKERLAKEEFRLTDNLAKLNKFAERFEKDSRIPFSVYVNVCETIMAAMIEVFPNKQHEKILEFFDEHINKEALKHK